MCFVNVRFCGSSSSFVGSVVKSATFPYYLQNIYIHMTHMQSVSFSIGLLPLNILIGLFICPFQVFCRLFIRFFCFSEIFPIIEISLIHSMTSFHFSVVPRCSWFYQPNRKRIIRTRLKRHNFGIFRLVIFARRQPCCIFRTKICSKFYPFQVTEF